MDIRTLPEREREIYNGIRQSYKVGFDKLKVKDKTIRLLKVEDLEEFLDGKDPFADVSEFPFWIKLWDAAMILSYLLASLPTKKGSTMLELGAGLGAPGLAAASVGFDVTLSDYEDIILDFQRVSAAASGLENVKCIHFDWLNPPDIGKFDVLAGAEVLFREEFFEPLLNVFKSCLKEDGAIYLAHDAGRKSLQPFLKMASKDFRISMNKQEIKRIDGKRTILVNCLKPKE